MAKKTPRRFAPKRAKAKQEKVRARKVAARKTVNKTRAARAAAKTPARPKDVKLPGLENMKDKLLSRLASNVADERHAQNESKAREAGFLQTAQQRMQKLNATVFVDHGVEFVRVPGEEKFRVRLTGDDDVPRGRGGAAQDVDEERQPPAHEFDTDAAGKPIDSPAGEDSEGEE